MVRRREYDVRELFRLWHDHTLQIREVAERLGLPCSTLVTEARRRGLPHRGRLKRSYQQSHEEEPSPEELAEIERRKAEVRERHFAWMRAKP